MVRVLLSDDAGFIRELLKNFLSSKNFEVVGEAASGPEAISLAKSLRPDLIFMDMVLPGLNGVNAAELILQENPVVKIIAMSALDDDLIMQKASNVGCRAYLRKPFNRETIMDAIVEVYKENSMDERKRFHG